MTEVYITVCLIAMLLAIVGIAVLNRWVAYKHNTEAMTTLAKFALVYTWKKSGCHVCWDCYNEQHEYCTSPDCQCKNEVCTEIRNIPVRGWGLFWNALKRWNLKYKWLGFY